MKIALPNNIIAHLFSYIIPEKYKGDIIYKTASLVSKEVVNENVDIALIPSFDLLSHPNFIVSKQFGISCDGLLSNANIFYSPNKNIIDKIGLFGDVTSNEMILPRIIYPEKFSTDITISLETKKPDINQMNYIVVGDLNYSEEYLNKGMSFAEEITEIINFPYVNFVLVSKDDVLLADFCSEIEKENVDIELILDSILAEMEYPATVKEFINDNFYSLYFELTESELVGLEEMLKLPYYHGILETMVELNFV